MGRLTYKNYIEEYEVNLEKSSDKNWSIAESDTHIKVTGEPIEKLGELEDVLEKWHIEDLDKFIEEQITKKRELNDILWKMEQELAELKQKAIVPKDDKFVIVSNAWKHNKKYGIAKVQQVMTDHYILQTNDYLGSYFPCIQYGEFKTKEEAEQKLAKIKGE